MYSAPDGIKKALEDFVSAARQQNLRLSVLLFEDHQGTGTDGQQVQVQAEGTEGRIPHVSQGETTQTERITSTTSPAGPSTSSTPREPSQHGQGTATGAVPFGTAQGGPSRRGSGVGKRSFAEQSTLAHASSGALGGSTQPTDPVVLVLNKPEADRIRQVVMSAVGQSPALQAQSPTLGPLPNIPRTHPDVPQDTSSVGRPTKRGSFHRLEEGLSMKRSRVGGETEESGPRRRPMSMPAIRTRLQLDPSGQAFQPPSMELVEQTKFWGTVLTSDQSGHRSRQYPDRPTETQGPVNPVQEERFPPLFQSKLHQKLNPDQPVEEAKPAGPIPSPLVGQMRSRSLMQESLGYPRQPTPLPSPSLKGAGSSLHSGSPSFRLDPASKTGESSYREVGTSEVRRDSLAPRDPVQPPSIFDSRAQFPRPTRMEMTPPESPFPGRGKSLSALPPLGRSEFPLLPSSHRGGPAGPDSLPRQAPGDLATGPHQPSLPSLARALSAHAAQGALPPARAAYQPDSVTVGSGEARESRSGLASRASAPPGGLAFGGRRDPLRLPPDAMHSPVEYVSTAGRSGSVMPRAGVLPGGSGATPQAFSCPQAQCEATFRRRSDMNRHIRVVHEKQRPFQCPTCSNRFGEKSNMIKHVRMVHQNIRGFRCQHCDAAFGQRGNCEAHVRAVHEKRPGKYSCEHCTRAFSRKAQLLEHHAQEHPDLPAPVARTRSRGGPSTAAAGVVAAPPVGSAPAAQQRIPMLRTPTPGAVAAQVYESAARSLLSAQGGFRPQQMQMRQQQHAQMPMQRTQSQPPQWSPPPPPPPPPQQQQQQMQPSVRDEQARSQAQRGMPGTGTYGMHPK